MDGVVKSAGRVLEVLEYFADKGEALRVSEIAEALGYPQSSASVLLRSLVQLGYLRYSARTRLYEPTIRTVLLGARMQRGQMGEQVLMEVMEDLLAKSGETVTLGVRNDIYLQYVRVLRSNSTIVFYIHPGTLRPLTRSALGRVLLSLQPDSEAKGLLRRINAEIDDANLRMSWTELSDEIELIRKRGWALVEGVSPGAASLAMLVPTPPDREVLALGIGAPIERMHKNFDRFLVLLNNAIDELRKVPGSTNQTLEQTFPTA